MNNLIYAINYLNEHSVDGNTVLEHSNANEAEAFEELVNQGMDDRYTADGQITLPELAGSLYRLHNPSMLFSEPPETGFTRLSEIEHSFLQSFATFQSEDVSSFGFEQASGIFLENISRISQHQDREIIARFAARQIIEECRNHRTQTDGQSARINLLLSMRTLIFPVLEEEFTHNPNADFAAVFLREMNHYDDIQTTRFLITLSYNMQGSYANRNAVDIHRFVTGVLGVRLRDVLQHHNNEQIELIVSAMVVACTSRSLEVSALANDVLRVLPDEYLNILGDILLSSCSRSVRVASALILGRHGRAGLPFLARVLSRPNAVPIEVYAAALRSLENVEGHDVMPHLRRALHHASPMIRMSAIRAMRRRELNEIETPLRPMLRDPDESVRLAAAMLLYTKGYHQAESTIRRIALRNEPDDTQWEAVRYLAERNIFIPETIATSLRNPDEQIRLDAFELLSSLEGDDENHLLVMSLSSPYSDIKLGAALYILSRYATFRDTAISFDQILRYNNELIPVLIRGLEIEDESNLSDEDALAIEAIANIFQLIGVQAIPHLVSELSNERKRAGVILSLARIGEMSLEVLAMDARYNPLMRGAVTSQ